jgi:glycosyltransferase involved in cell wall biosynthesis
MWTPDFRLVCATKGRVADLERMFRSLAIQTCRHFHLVLVDQNGDDTLLPLVEKYRAYFPIRHERASVQGVSAARNVGLFDGPEELIGYPDDDCWYPHDLLERVVAFFSTHPEIDLLTGPAQDESGAPVGGWDADPGPITRENVWARCIGFNLFLRASAARRIGHFNVEIGAGSATPYGSGEETEYVLRAIGPGLRTYYDPEFVVGHPDKKYTSAGVARAFLYGAGMGYVLRRQRCAPRQVVRFLIRPLLGAGLLMALGRFMGARYQFLTFKGRAYGYIASGRQGGTR